MTLRRKIRYSAIAWGICLISAFSAAPHYGAIVAIPLGLFFIVVAWPVYAHKCPKCGSLAYLNFIFSSQNNNWFKMMRRPESCSNCGCTIE